MLADAAAATTTDLDRRNLDCLERRKRFLLAGRPCGAAYYFMPDPAVAVDAASFER